MPTVASKRLLLDHPELYHYTTGNGLVGILKSNTIWATHFSDLNDATEVRLLREPLIKALSGRFKELVREHQSGGVRIRKAVAQHGGVQRVSAELANDLVNRYPYAEGRLPESLHFAESDVILGVVRARSVHKIGYGHNCDWAAA